MSKRNVKILKHFESPKEPGTYFRLICLVGESKGLAYFLVGQRIIMGRSDTADIKVLDIKSSREHAEIVKNQNKFILTDLGSHNGVIVNDFKVKQHALSEGDSIVIGQTVYKFSKVVIVRKDEAIETNAKKENPDEDEEQEKKPFNKKVLILAFLFVAAFLLLDSEENTEVEGKRVKERGAKVDQIVSMAFKKKKKEDKDKQAKMSVYFSRGLREYREGNYFRAMSEFENALSWSPNDSLALFYLRKTKDALNKSVEELFNTARRDEDSLKYKRASVSYCAVIRLLYKYPKDERYKEAEKKVREIEGKLGLDEGQVECLQKIK